MESERRKEQEQRGGADAPVLALRLSFVVWRDSRLLGAILVRRRCSARRGQMFVDFGLQITVWRLVFSRPLAGAKVCVFFF